jgi:hypothetical protein
VHQAENVIENLGVVRVLFEPDEFDIDGVEAFVRLCEEFLEQVVHAKKPFTPESRWRHAHSGIVVCKCLILVAVYRAIARLTNA